MRVYLYTALLIWNIIVFISYGIDKAKARKWQWRISERSLILMALCLGGFGAMMGGHFFRHKTQKWYFNVTWCFASGLLVLVLYMIWRGHL